MSVRAKFKVTQVQTHGEVKTADPQGNPHVYHPTSVTLAPVYVNSDARKEGNKENEMFGFYTPNGSIQMSINNDAASEQFKPDAVFYVDFTPAEA